MEPSSFWTLLCIILSVWLTSGDALTPGCRLTLTNPNQPTLLDSTGKALVPRLDTKTGSRYVDTQPGARLKLRCPDPRDSIQDSERSEADVVCIRGSLIRIWEDAEDFDDVRCERERDRLEHESVYRNGTCFNNFTNVEIALVKFQPHYTLIKVCHNEDADETLYVKSFIRGADLARTETSKRPGFKEGGFFTDIDANRCYSTSGQLDTIALLLGSATLATHYIQPRKNLFLARGHLSPNADGIESYEKRATFYFLNTVPQWQSINGGNWNQLESAARRIAAKRGATLTVYTGAYGVTTLDDLNDNPVKIWLGRAKNGTLLQRLPVPQLMWKVLHDEVENEAVAVIQVNNPWRTVSSGDILCPDQCADLPWVKWKVRDVKLGYTYCCNVAAFHKALPYAPDLGNIPLLV